MLRERAEEAARAQALLEKALAGQLSNEEAQQEKVHEYDELMGHAERQRMKEELLHPEVAGTTRAKAEAEEAERKWEKEQGKYRKIEAIRQKYNDPGTKLGIMDGIQHFFGLR